MLLHFFHSLHNAVTQAWDMLAIGTALTRFPMGWLFMRRRGRKKIKTFFSCAFLSPGTKEVTVRTIRGLILCIPYFAHLSAPFLLSFCYTVHLILFQPWHSSIKQIHIPEILQSLQRSILFSSHFFSLHFLFSINKKSIYESSSINALPVFRNLMISYFFFFLRRITVPPTPAIPAPASRIQSRIGVLSPVFGD